RWFAAGHFSFLGYRRYDVDPAAGTRTAAPGSGLGVLHAEPAQDDPDGPADAVHRSAPGAPVLVLTTASVTASVRGSTTPYLLGVRETDSAGRVTVEHRFVGALPVVALHEDVLDIPVLRGRTRDVVAAAGFELDSFSGQELLEVVQTYPRTELFATNTDTLSNTVSSVLAVADQRSARLFLRQDTYGRFVSCLVYLPRDRYTTRSRTAVQELLLRELDGESLEHTARVTESALALLHVTVHTRQRVELAPGTQQRLQQMVTEASRTWADRLAEALRADGAADAVELATSYAQHLPEAYKEDFDAVTAVAHLKRLRALAPGGFDVTLTPPGSNGELRLTLYLAGSKVSLSDVLPLLQSMDVVVLDERPYEVRRPDGATCWLYDFGLTVNRTALGPGDGLDGGESDSGAGDLRARFTDAVTAMWTGRAECDRFNALVLHAGLSWRQAALVRTLARYLRQAGLPFSQPYVEQVTRDNADICRGLVGLFEARLDPALGQPPTPEQLHPRVAEVAGMIDAVAALDADRILRAMLSVVQATLRTSYWVTDEDGALRPYLSIKLDPRSIAELPQPRPRFEVFVCSPRVEGVHLRFGAVARGGLRWSDRREDFRTEVLGLVKAQAVKNAVIVPVGAKGGFVLKQPPIPTGDAGADREALQAEGIACYRLFISALLDLTDNLDPVSGTVLPPDNVLRHDGDDTYLVVAADKGTASFSDIANAVAIDYGYWLGDAFASGGSAGYDHKDMGITAKGAWESVRRHFRELGLDTQSEEFTVVGVGDMSGDVFGNGMLLSPHIRLVAAFDHRHVFLDPSPDAARSFGERERLFALPRSSWADYDTALISEGGGVYPRTLKSVPVSGEVRQALGLGEDVEHLTPEELVRAVLLAPVDLLWNGGIGTYVKAGAETHAEVGDKANDGLRVNGSQLRVRVVGEGGNLGMTQRGRVEYARTGGKVNTDALDNSAGVDCSDHEVNIKILLDALVTDGTLAVEDRNPLLESMTDEVARLVLTDNIDQNELMGVSRTHAGPMVSVHARLVGVLESSAGLVRSLEALPTVAGFAALDKAGEGLTSPELATLMAQVKLALKHEVLASGLPELDVFARRLPHYFPHPLPERFPTALRAHPLRREIVATQVVNDVVDTGGITYAFRLSEESGASATDAVRAHAVSTEVFALDEIREQLMALGATAPTDLSDQLTLEVRRLLDRASRWFLSNRPQPLAVGAEISRFTAAVRELSPHVEQWLCGAEKVDVQAQVAAFVDRGAPEPLARRVVELLRAYCLLDVVEVAELAEREPAEVGPLYFALSDHLDVDLLLTAVSTLERGDRWHSLARLALRDDLYGSLRALTLDVLSSTEPEESPAEKIEQWESTNASRMARARTALAEIAEVHSLDLA
ncbi:MAG: NAD-glutamate dehydrogenase, partial [Mycobacteriaceae bacterium]